MTRYLSEDEVKLIFKPTYYKNIPVRLIKSINITYSDNTYREFDSEDIKRLLGEDGKDTFIKIDKLYRRSDDIEELEIVLNFELIAEEINEYIDEIMTYAKKGA